MSETSGATPQAFGGAAPRSVAYHDLASYGFAAGGTSGLPSVTVSQSGGYSPAATGTGTATNAQTTPYATPETVSSQTTSTTTATPWPCVGETFPSPVTTAVPA
jgi:hypothetical protein